MRTASLGTLGLSWSATWRHWAFALSAVLLGEGGGDEGGDGTRRPWRPAMGQQVAHEVHAAALPCGAMRVAAAFSPLWSSEITSFTPRSPRRARLRRNSVQKVSASDAPIATPRIAALGR